MIRLVSQFDRSDRRLAIATPSCACACCCCCCCLAATVTIASFTSFNLRAAAAQQGTSRMRRDVLTHLGWLLTGVPLIALGWAALGGHSVLLSNALVVVPIILAVVLSILYWQAGQRGPLSLAIVTIMVGTGLFFLDAILGLFAFLFGGLGLLLLLEFGLAAGGTAAAWKLVRSRRAGQATTRPPS